MSCQCRIQGIPNKGRFSASAHTGNCSYHPQRELHRHILQVVLHSTANLNEMLPFPLLLGYLYLLYSRQIINCKRSAGGCIPLLPPLKGLSYTLLNTSLVNHFSSIHTSIRANIYKFICTADYLLIMLHNKDGIPQIPQILYN